MKRKAFTLKFSTYIAIIPGSLHSTSHACFKVAIKKYDQSERKRLVTSDGVSTSALHPWGNGGAGMKCLFLSDLKLAVRSS